MICVRSPFRIALAGGGTDLPAFYMQHGSTLLTCAIDKYIHVLVRQEHLTKQVSLRHYENEITDFVNDLKHSRARECLKYFGISSALEITSTADILPGTGMGSSGSYLVSLICGLSQLKNASMTKYEIANLACELEMSSCNQPVGKQDQFISAFGGIKTLKTSRDGHVRVEESEISSNTKALLNKNCMIFYTGKRRNASVVLGEQQAFIKSNSDPMVQIQRIGLKSISALEAGDVDAYGELMHEHWQQKKSMSGNMSISEVDKVYLDLYDSKRILGGKIIGAGGGGFLLVYVNKSHDEIENDMLSRGFLPLKWSFDEEGVKIVCRT